MFYVISAIFLRIFSNSYLNVFQKILTNRGNKSSVVNFYTYLGLSVLCIPLLKNISITGDLLFNVLTMGLLGAAGNYFIIKALSLGELSSLAPINSYKPVIAMLIGIFYLGEIPSFAAISGILLIITGTYIIYGSQADLNKKALLYRFVALVLSGTEAVFIKKVILLTNIPISFGLWAISGLIFSAIFISKYTKELQIIDKKYQLLLIASVGLMQLSTNYVFAKINVSYALALFQLSTLISVFLGANVFHEKDITRKVIASVIMIAGAIVIILS